MSGPELESRFHESTPEEIGAVKTALAPYIKDADLAADLEGQPSRFRTQTKVWIGITAAAVASWFAGGGLAVTGIVASFISIPGLLVAGGNDLLQESARDRSTPMKALRCYLRAVRFGRWKEGLAALGKPARDKPETVPKIKKLESQRQTIALATPYALKSYWESLIRTSHGMTRLMTGYSIEPLATDGDVHRYRVTVRIRAYRNIHHLLLLWGVIPGALFIWMFLTRRFRSSFEIYVYKHKSQWWLESGKLGLPDRVAKLPAAKIIK